MCFKTQVISSVCGHSHILEERCPAKKRSDESGVFYNIMCLSLPGTGCRGPSDRSRFVVGFCGNCSAHYNRLGYSANTYAEILNYWLFKRETGIYYQIPATLVPAEQVFGKPSPPEHVVQQLLGDDVEVLDSVYRWKQGDLMAPSAKLQYLSDLRKSTIAWAKFGIAAQNQQPKPTPKMTAAPSTPEVGEHSTRSTGANGKGEKVETVSGSPATETGDDVPASSSDTSPTEGGVHKKTSPPITPNNVLKVKQSKRRDINFRGSERQPNSTSCSQTKAQ